MSALTSMPASSAMPRRKCAFSHSGRSATHTSASDSACFTWNVGEKERQLGIRET